ncbi:MAG TPA: glycosyltransferase family 4 protein [Candidatus Binataceae bacterium]|nr:glycosyltransferase family 4 protein [Candidatus Binataceae bacterium]
MAIDASTLSRRSKPAALGPANGTQCESLGRILIIAYSHYIFDARVKRHAEALAQAGYEVDVICLADPQETQKWVNIIPVSAPRYRGQNRIEYLRQYARFFLQASYLAAKHNHKRRYDVVIVCSIPDAAIVSGVIPKLYGSRLILDMHDTMPELYLEKFPGRSGTVVAAALKLEERVSAWTADLVFAVHTPHAERLQAAGIPREKIVVIVNSPDPRLFPLPRSQDDEDADDDSFTIVTHGTINRRLGLDTAVEAIGLIRDRIPKLKFRIIGPGEHLETVRHHTIQRSLEDIVEFEDGVPLESLARTLQRVSVGLVPNHATAATQLMLPVKLLEYVNLGIPVVASNLRTIREYFPENAVLYFEPSNPRSLADGLLDLYSNPTERKNLALQALESLKGISWEVQRQKLCEAVTRLMTGRLEAVEDPAAI